MSRPVFVFVCKEEGCEVQYETPLRTPTPCPVCGGESRRRYTPIPHTWDFVAAP